MKVFDMLAHEGYHYELCKLGCDFIIMTNTDQGWDRRYRPIPNNVKLVSRNQITKEFVESHDVAIIRNYKHFCLLRECKLPKIIVMHCSKAGQGDYEFGAEDLENFIVVFNSHKDRVRWNLECPSQYVVWHGFDPNEWPVSDRSIGRILTIGRLIAERPRICGYKVIAEFEKSGIPLKVVGDNPALNIEAPSNFEEFRLFHRTYAAYLNPTLVSPMPRARGEAMMSGLPIITTDLYDEEMFIENGVNGFKSSNIDQLKEYAALVLADKSLQEELAKNARSTAIKEFHIDRFLKQWQDILTQATNKTISIPVLGVLSKPKIFITKKDSSAGGGTVSSNNAIEGLKTAGYEVSCLDINSKGWVAFVNGEKLPTNSGRIWKNYIKDHPCDLLIFDDIERYKLCKDVLPERCKVIVCILGNPQVHPSCWYEKGILDLDRPDNRISKILCRPIYARYLQGMFGDRVVSWVGGCDGEDMRVRYGTARYKHPKNGALIISAHRGTDWWKNPNTAILAAYAICKKYPECIYFKPSGNDMEKKLLENVNWDIQYGGTPKEGMTREELLYVMACGQIALEPGYSEGFSRSCNELMNLGVPVVQGPNAEHILGNPFLAEHLLVRDPSNAQDVVEKALKLLENEELWTEVSKESIRFSSQFNKEQEMNVLRKAVKDVLSDKV